MKVPDVKRTSAQNVQTVFEQLTDGKLDWKEGGEEGVGHCSD